MDIYPLEISNGYFIEQGIYSYDLQFFFLCDLYVQIWCEGDILQVNSLQFAIENGPCIVDLPIKDGDFI